MDPFSLGIISIIGIITLVFLGVRVAFAAGFVGVVGLIVLRGWSAGGGMAGLTAHASVTHYTLSVLPMFILIGYLAFYAGLTQGAFRCARAWFGWLPGGLAVATVFATAGFAAVSGASTATAAVFSRVAIPEMLKYDYDRRLAAGVVAAGGTLASLIPPSAILVIYAIIVEESVGALLLAGFIPGAASAVVYAAIIIFRCKLNPSLGMPVRGLGWGERFNSIPGLLPIVVVIWIILGGFYTGWMTPTETAFADWIVHLDMPRLAILLLILLVYIVLGMFMDGIGMLLLTLPVVHPAIMALGYDPIWFGIIVVKMVEIGLVTPPIGLNCFVVNGVRPDIPLEEVFKGIWPFVVADFITVGILIAFPGIVLYLPELMITNISSG